MKSLLALTTLFLFTLSVNSAHSRTFKKVIFEVEISYSHLMENTQVIAKNNVEIRVSTDHAYCVAIIDNKQIECSHSLEFLYETRAGERVIGQFMEFESEEYIKVINFILEKSDSPLNERVNEVFDHPDYRGAPVAVSAKSGSSLTFHDSDTPDSIQIDFTVVERLSRY